MLSATLGCLLGIILTTRSQKVTGRRAGARLLAYASVAFGVTAIWQADVLALTGAGGAGHDPALRPGHVARQAWARRWSPSAAGMFVVGYGRAGFAGWWRRRC